MRYLPIAICGLAACLVPLSCTIDSYEKGEGDLSLLTAELVEAHVGVDKSIGTIVTDQDERLTLDVPVTASWIQTGDTVYRALMYYKRPAGSATVSPVSLSSVGVLLPRDSIRGGMKTDPLHLESAWLAKNRRYLNLRLRLLTGTTDDETARQTIGLLADTLASTPTHQRLSLYHDQGGQPEYYSVVTYASMPLSGAADTLTLTVSTYDDGVISKTFVVAP